MWKTEEVPKVYLTALCAWREARGESDEGIRAVLHVIDNRARKPSWWGSGHEEVVLKPYQFSSFNADDPNASKLPRSGDARFRWIMDRAALVIMREDEDLTGGATHYHTLEISPPWADGMVKCATIGSHVFYKEKP